MTQWAYSWGQFVDHSIGLRESGDELLSIRFDPEDPLEYFTNEDDVLRITRSGVAEGSGATTPREQINTVSSYIDAAAVYGGEEYRLEWLREGPFDGDLSNNGARLLLTNDGYLPRAIERGDAASAPVMDLQGELLFAPNSSERLVVSGDTRANENIALTSVQTLFAREHNRIVNQLPASWTEQRKFDTARQLVIAIQQYITYEEFLPALGVHLTPAEGYRADIDASVSSEFATVGFRAHSMIHGEIEVVADTLRYVELRGANHEVIELGTAAADSDAVSGVRGSTLAARLKGIYGEVDAVDAFVGMISEPHPLGNELGELQQAIWRQQFEASRDGDRYFYEWNKALPAYDKPADRGALTYRHTLADLIIDNTDLDANDVCQNMFLSKE